MAVIATLKKMLGRTYPLRIQLDYLGAPLRFQVFSDVERYRIADYGEEKDFLYAFLKSLCVDDVVFDIGASVGLMTVHAAKVVVRGKVVSFEPDPQCCQRLINNVALNGFGNVVVQQLALSNEAGETVLFTDGASGCAPTLRHQPDREGAPSGKAAIATETLHGGMARGLWPLPTVLKIDIEGAEMLCLQGADLLLRGRFGAVPRMIFLEMHPQFLPDFGSDPDQVRSYLLERGYRVEHQTTRDDQEHWFLRHDSTL